MIHHGVLQIPRNRGLVDRDSSPLPLDSRSSAHQTVASEVREQNHASVSDGPARDNRALAARSRIRPVSIISLKRIIWDLGQPNPDSNEFLARF